MKNVNKARGRVFLVALFAAGGLLATAAPGLAAETDPVPLTAAAPVAPTGDPDPGDDPDAATSGSGWKSGGSSDPAPPPDETAGDQPSDGPADGGGDYSADPQPLPDDSYSKADDRPSKKPTARETANERAAAQKAAKKARAAQQSADRKASAAKKSSAARKNHAKQATAKRMQAQAKKAAQEASRRAAAERARARADQQRRASADDQPADNPRSGGGGTSIDSVRNAILNLTNKARSSAGCGSLRYSTMLEKSAQWMANDMSEKHYMSHTAKNGKDFDRRIRDTGYDGNKTGENLGEGFSSAEAVFKAWMNSPSHRANILDCKFRIIGIGFNASGGTWAQHFGS